MLSQASDDVLIEAWADPKEQAVDLGELVAQVAALLYALALAMCAVSMHSAGTQEAMHILQGMPLYRLWCCLNLHASSIIKSSSVHTCQQEP